MNFDCKKLIDLYINSSFVTKSNNQFIVYGAGSTGANVAQYLLNIGQNVAAVLDIKTTKGLNCAGLPVYTLKEWLQMHNPENYQVIVAIHNRGIEVAKIIENLKFARFNNVFTMIDYISAYPDGQPFYYWLQPRQKYYEIQHEIGMLFDLLEDKQSHHLLKAILYFRISGDYRYLSGTMSDSQYMPTDIIGWTNKPIRLIDCGAYDGDSIRFISKHQSLEATVAFEPDITNFKILTQKCNGLNVISFPCGVYSETKQVYFNYDGESSRINDSGEKIIQCVALDDAVPEFVPNMIKMDIEGFEMSGLKGAYKLISKNRPNLAICLYHLPTDLWEIPLLINSWNLDYKFYIRSHGYNSFETVLYAVYNPTLN